MYAQHRMPRALVVTTNFPLPVTSGGRKRNVRLLEAMERAGARPHLLSLDPNPVGASEARMRGWTVELLPAPRPTLSNRFRQHLYRDPVLTSVSLLSRITALAGRSAFVELEEIRSVQYARAVPKRTPLVASLHNVDSDILRMSSHGTGLRRLGTRYLLARMTHTERRTARRADALLCVSERDLSHFAGIGARGAILAPNGVDDDLLDVPATLPSAPRVLFFGSFFWAPNTDGARRFLAESWPRVIAHRPDARLAIAGHGSRDALRDVVTDVPGVELLGFVDDLRGELAASCMAVAPLWVGGGTRIKVLEALAAARPVVGTTLGVEQIGFAHNRHGLIADTPAAIGDAVLRLLNDRELAQRLAHGARDLGKRYRWSTVLKPAQDFYAACIARGATSTHS